MDGVMDYVPIASRTQRELGIPGFVILCHVM